MNARRTMMLAAAAVLLTTAHAAMAQPGRAMAQRGPQQERQQPQRGGDEEQPQQALPQQWADAMQWRSIGPAVMGGRITALSVYEADPCIWWAATASGGLLKTTNAGTTFEHQFDSQSTVSIGDVAVAQSDPSIVWVGTGENNPRNSVSWGDGVYKSTDGGATWTNMGLRETFQIGSVVVHPTNPDIVYVGALGRLWGPNEQRGLFKTSDGGKTWEKIHYVDDKTGVIDIAMHPEDPDTLLFATYERQRDDFDTNDPAKKVGPGAGLYRTTDGGATFEKLTEGLPSGELGRIGLSWYRADPKVIYAVVESDRIGQQPENQAYLGVTGADAEVGARITDVVADEPAAQAGLQAGDVIIRMAERTILSYGDLLAEVRRHLEGETVLVEIARDGRSESLEVTFARRPDAREDEDAGDDESDEEADEPAGPRGPRGQRRARNPFQGGLGGQTENLQDQQGPDGHEYGGVYRSENGGDSWARINSVNPRPMYFSRIGVDPSDESYIYVLGVSLYTSEDGGETFDSNGHRGENGSIHVDHHAIWVDPNDGRHIILGNDGGLHVTRDRMKTWDHLNHVAIGQFYHVGVDATDNYRVYGGLQDNGSWGGPIRARNGSGPINEDWFRVGGGDGFICLVDDEDPEQVYFESQNGGLGRRHLGTGAGGSLRPRAPRGQRYRFNWKTPFLLSPHNSRIYYTAGNHVFRSLDRGNGLQAVSPEITNTDRGAASALAESPRAPGVLYVGTDDGALWMTRDGSEWVDLFEISAEAPDAAEADDAADGDGEQGPGRGRGAGRGGLGRGAGGARRMADMLRRADADGDGRISRSEMPERAARMFDRLDTNGDGAIDQTELQAMQERGRGGAAPPERESEAAASEEATSEEATSEEAASEQPQERRRRRPRAATGADPVSGEWAGRATNENMPPDQGGFTLRLQLGDDDTVTGELESSINQGEIENGAYVPDTGRLTFDFEGEQMTLVFNGTVSGSSMTGTIEIGDGMFVMQFEAARTARAVSSDAGAGETAAPGDTIGELLPGPRRISSIDASRFENGRVYVSADGHRQDDDEVYVFVSENFGRTWQSLRANLPTSTGPVRVVREDITNPNILYLGCEFSTWVSIDRGVSWTSLNGTLPTVAVHEIAQHPTSGEIIAGTHGRSLWVLDVTALRQLTPDAPQAPALLLKPADVHYWRSEPSRGGDLRRFVGANPTDDAQISYVLTQPADDISLTITGGDGRALRELTADGSPGLHRVTWDLRREARRGGNQGGQGRFRRRFGPRVEPGTYYAVLEVGDETYRQAFRVDGDPEYPSLVLWGETYDEQMSLLGQFEEGSDGDEDDG